MARLLEKLWIFPGKHRRKSQADHLSNLGQGILLRTSQPSNRFQFECAALKYLIVWIDPGDKVILNRFPIFPGGETCFVLISTPHALWPRRPPCIVRDRAHATDRSWGHGRQQPAQSVHITLAILEWRVSLLATRDLP